MTFEDANVRVTRSDLERRHGQIGSRGLFHQGGALQIEPGLHRGNLLVEIVDLVIQTCLCLGMAPDVCV